MAINSEIPINEAGARSARRGMSIANKAGLKGIKGIGRTAKLGGSGVLKTVRWARRNRRDLALIGLTAAALKPYQTVDFSKNVVSGATYAYHDPKEAAGSTAAETGQVLLNAADAAVSNAGQLLRSKKPEAKGGVEVEQLPSTFDLAFPHVSGQDREDAFIKVIDARNDLNLHHPKEVSEAAYKYKDLVDKYCGQYGVPKNLMMGLIIAESKANPKAFNAETGAKGLTQITKIIADKYNLEISGGEDDPNFKNDQRFDEETAIRVAAQEIKGYFEKEGTWAGAFQMWHMGEPQYIEMKLTYFRNKGINLDNPLDPDIDWEEGQRRTNALLAQTIEDGTSPFLVFKDKDNGGIIIARSWNGTGDYLAFIVAADAKYEEEKPKHPKVVKLHDTKVDKAQPDELKKAA